MDAPVVVRAQRTKTICKAPHKVQVLLDYQDGLLGSVVEVLITASACCHVTGRPVSAIYQPPGSPALELYQVPSHSLTTTPSHEGESKRDEARPGMHSGVESSASQRSAGTDEAAGRSSLEDSRSANADAALGNGSVAAVNMSQRSAVAALRGLNPARRDEAQPAFEQSSSPSVSACGEQVLPPALLSQEPAVLLEHSLSHRSHSSSQHHAGSSGIGGCDSLDGRISPPHGSSSKQRSQTIEASMQGSLSGSASTRQRPEGAQSRGNAKARRVAACNLPGPLLEPSQQSPTVNASGSTNAGSAPHQEQQRAGVEPRDRHEQGPVTQHGAGSDTAAASEQVDQLLDLLIAVSMIVGLAGVLIRGLVMLASPLSR